MVVCRVALLDGSQFEPRGIDRNSEGQLVFDKVCKQLDIIETDYFGLTYRDKTGKKFWLDNTKKISKQLKGGTWVFEFQVKFYPPDPMSLKEDITRYQLCLQVRVDLFNGRLPCSFATIALLGSYTVQSELGDWDEREFGTDIGYLRDFDFVPDPSQELLEKIAELHKNHRGQSPTVAEAHFLENAKKLAKYGVDLHDVKDYENKQLSLGICATGILVYKDRLRISRFVWPKILKLSYKRDAFYVKIRPGEYEPHEKTVCFRCDSHKLAKRLWKTCVEHHAFFRLKTADPPNADTLFPRFNTRFRYSGRTAVQARKAAELANREEPHITRTAERRSMTDKNRSLDDMALKERHPDENDMYDNKHGDPNATMERDRTAAGLYGQNATAPHGEDASDKRDLKGQEPETEGPPGYSADTSALSEGGKKSKKDKEEEKKRKKEEERRRKEEEKERKRLEKEKKKEKEKEDKKAGVGLFGGLLRRSQRDKSDKSKSEKDEKAKAGPALPVDDHVEQKPKPVPTWALPGMQELMEKRANQEAARSNIPRIEVEEAPPQDIDPDSQEYETDYQSKSATVYQSEPRAENSIVLASTEGDNSSTEQPDQLKEDFLQLLRETPDITSTSRLDDVKHKIEHDPRYKAVDDDTRKMWFKEYVDDMLKADFMRLLRETPSITSNSTWPEARAEIDNDPRFLAVDSEAQRQLWFEEYQQGLIKSEFMEMLKDSPAVDSNSQWDGVREYLQHDPRYKAVNNDAQREEYFDEYIQNLKKEEFMQLLDETPDITSYSRYPDVREDISNDPRFHNVGSESLREQYFNEYVLNLKKANYFQLLQDTPDITAYSRWHESKHLIDTDPRYQAVDTDLHRAQWFNQYVNRLAGIGYGDVDFGLRIGGYKSIDRKQEFLPITPSSTATKSKSDNRMPFFEPAGESDTDVKKRPPPVAKKPRGHSGYDSEEDRLLTNHDGVPVTVKTETFKYSPDLNEEPRSTSNIPIVETTTHKVTYEKDGIPYETEDTILISAHSVTTKSTTIDTTTYKTERDGVVETRVERKITVTSDENDDIDHDALLRKAIEDVTMMNPDLSVEKIECMRQIEEMTSN